MLHFDNHTSVQNVKKKKKKVYISWNIGIVIGLALAGSS